MENKSEVLEPVAYKDGSLWVKLEIPEDEGFFSQQNHHHQIMKNGTERVCHVCHKVFSSGKALGGHMRIHVQQAKNNDNKLINFKKQNTRDQEEIENSSDFDIMVKKKPICAICGRDFPSMKSLSGHLRCHPDRGWRGIQPPQLGKYSSSSFSHSSLSDTELSSEIDDDLELVIDDNEDKKRIVNLAESLSIGWVMTARRGRKAAVVGSSLEEDELLCIAAHDLMMLSRGLMNDKQKRVGAAKAPKTTTKTFDTESVSTLKNRRKFDEVEKTIKLVCYSSDDDEDDIENLSSKISGDPEEDFSNNDLKVLVKSKKRIKKRVKLSDLDHQMAGNAAAPRNDKLGAAAGDRYRCDACGKSFPTYQALGGHMSSHNKFKLAIQNSIAKDHEKNLSSADGPLSQVASTGEASETCIRMLDFDLNEKLPSEDDEA